MQTVSSIVKEIREPCLYHSPSKRSKMLNPEKWQTFFDGEGKVLGFRKALKLIILGGVDPSIRAEVWEFLLGCYALSSTADNRRHLRIARRERYDDLIRQCQAMHSSIGTGTLAYVVGSKVMDMRTSSKYKDSKEAMNTIDQASQHATNPMETYSDPQNGFMNTSYRHKKWRSNNSVELYSVRMDSYSSARESCSIKPPSLEYSLSGKAETEFNKFQYPTESFYDFPSLPATNLFEKDGTVDNGSELHDDRLSVSKHTFRFRDDRMHSFQINNNVELLMESNNSTLGLFRAASHGAEFFDTYFHEQARTPEETQYINESVNKRRISNALSRTKSETTTSYGLVAHDERVSEWLWTLHRIVVDVVRTDIQLEFYGDSKNTARMSDILAVYAWIDPATGYCQGMSDLLSPFVVLYEDNADAFWCFEMLLRRMRENFQMEGPIGVIKQLKALWKILERSDAILFEHLSVIGAESLHFAFRMLLVLFRRELSFNEALFMWEMMWAADFDEAGVRQLDQNCLEPLLVHVSYSDERDANANCDEIKLKGLHSRFKPETRETDNDELRSSSSDAFCGLTKATFWSRNGQFQPCNSEPIRNRDDELPVFCVAAILIINRQKILRETHSIDDVIKMFNDNMLKINVKRCIRMAIKLRKKYFYKL